MIFNKTSLNDAFTLDLQKHGDHRGFFARTMCVNEFKENGIPTDFVQQNNSLTKQKGSLRGMHLQRAPYGEGKLVRCLRGALYDVIIDLRPDSSTFMKWEGFELNEDNRTQLFVPAGFAHGFQTLTDDVEALYLVTNFYTPKAEWGVKYNDPSFNIEWPIEVADISEKDDNWPAFETQKHLTEPMED